MLPDREMNFCGEPNCEDYWIECSVCGCEFCSKCHPGSVMCPDCAEQAVLDSDDDDAVPDFEDVGNVDSIIEEMDSDDGPPPNR